MREARRMMTRAEMERKVLMGATAIHGGGSASPAFPQAGSGLRQAWGR